MRPGQEKIFSVVDGAIKTDSSGAGSTLLTKEDYANFILKAEFRASPDVNSGLMLRNPRPRPAADCSLVPAAPAPPRSRRCSSPRCARNSPGP